jgi:MFS family permease
MTVATLLTIVTAPLAGSLVDRYGPRRILLASAATLPFLVAALAAIDGQLWRYYLVIALIAVLGAGTLPGTYTAISLGWFDRHRGLAVGFPIAGVGIANVLLPPAIQLIMPGYGWRGAVVAAAVAMFVVVLPLAWFLFRLAPRGPAELDGGLAPAVDLPAPEATAPADALPLRAQLLSRPFIQLAAAFLLLGVATLGVIINFQAMLEDAGVPALTAAQLLSLHGVFLIGFRLGSGWLLDRFPPRAVAGILILCPVAGILILAAGLPVAAIAGAMLLLAIGFGGEFNAMSFFVSRYFGQAAYGRLYGFAYSAYIVGGSIGPTLLASSYDHWGTYRYGLCFLAALIVAAVGLILSLPPLPGVVPRPHA